MRLPGFTASRSLESFAGSDRRGRSAPSHLIEVRPASCFGDCFQGCVADGGMSKGGCSAMCSVECGGKPPDNPPHVCVPTDNSVNHTLCVGAQDAWVFAAQADCSVLLGGVPVVGPALVAACKAGVGRIANETKAACPPAVICV